MLIAARKRYRGGIGKIFFGHQRQALRGFGADEVLHVDRLTGAQQRSIEDGGSHVWRRLIVSRQVKSPRLDSLLPGRMHKTEVVAPARGHQHSAIQTVKRLHLMREVVTLVVAMIRVALRKV